MTAELRPCEQSKENPQDSASVPVTRVILCHGDFCSSAARGVICRCVAQCPRDYSRMPIRSILDTERRLAITTGEGRVTADEIRALRDQALSDPNFVRDFNQIVDLRAVTNADISADEARALASTEIFSRNSKIALVASTPSVFGVARMFSTYNEMSKSASQIRVFYDLSSALEWLGLKDLPDAIKPGSTKAEVPADSGSGKKNVTHLPVISRSGNTGTLA